MLLTNKTYKKLEVNLDDVYGDLSLNNHENKFQEETFKYEKQLPLVDTTNRLKALELIKNTNLELIVPGNTKYNKVFQTAKIVMNGQTNSEEGRDKGDIRMSGKYLCTKIIDKVIMGTTYTQKLTMNRVDYSKG